MAKQHTPSTAPRGQARAATRPAVAPGDWFVPSTHADHHLFVHHRPARAQAREPGRSYTPIIFLHGATFSGSAIYDVPLPGGSWMEFAAARGYDTFAMDVRGYGKSSGPAALQQAAFHSPPLVHTEDAVQDLDDVVRAVLERTGAEHVNLVGWSWGTSIGGGYAAQYPQQVRAVALFAPLWIMRDLWGLPVSRSPLWPAAWLSPMISRSAWWVGAWRDVDARQARMRQTRGVAPELVEELLPQEQFEQWWAKLEADGLAMPASHGESGSFVRAPNGVMSDLMGRWAAAYPTWDPARVRAPTLLVAGAQDTDTPPSMANELYDALKNAARKRLLVLDKGTHWMTLQTNRFALYQSVQEFIDRPYGPDAGAAATDQRSN